jgi:hypothetical protein
LAAGAEPGRRARLARERELAVYFYELHEGDDELFSDVLLARETEMDPDVFFDIVQTIRRRVQDSHDHDTLIEAIAEELDREYEFIYISDERLTASVNVSTIEKDNFLADLDGSNLDAPDEDDEDREEDEEPEDDEGVDDEDVADLDDLEPGPSDGEVRTLLVDLDRNPDLPIH